MRRPLTEVMRIINITGGHFGFRVLFGGYIGLSNERSISVSIPANIKSTSGETLDGEETFNDFIENLKKIIGLNIDNCKFEILNKRDEIFNEDPIIKFKPFPYSEYNTSSLKPSDTSTVLELYKNGGFVE